MPQQVGTTPGRHLLLYDGNCAFCNRLVTFVLRRDAHRVFDFAALESEVGKRQRQMLDDPVDDDTVRIVVDYRSAAPRLLSRSTAALFIASALGRPWRWFRFARLVPRRLRDAVYDLVARYRYRVFGRAFSCLLPRPEDKARFIDQVSR